MIAALYVERGGVYFGLPDVDPWDEERDARLYVGPWPVVAHPPCARWSRLAGLVESRGGPRRGEDGGCFASALKVVRQWGGVLEHPAESAAFRHFHIARPLRGGWMRASGGWVCEVAQSAYGHRAQKLTWLYYVGDVRPPALNWERPTGTARVSEANGQKRKPAERIGRRERIKTPLAFRDVLLAMARSAGRR